MIDTAGDLHTHADDVAEFRSAAARWLAANKHHAPRDYGAICPPDLVRPAVAWHRRIHDAGYAGIQRWAAIWNHHGSRCGPIFLEEMPTMQKGIASAPLPSAVLPLSNATVPSFLSS